MAEEKNLTNEELEQAAGGKRIARAPQGELQGGGTVVPDAGDSNDGGNDGPTHDGGTPIDDPAFQ